MSTPSTPSEMIRMAESIERNASRRGQSGVDDRIRAAELRTQAASMEATPSAPQPTLAIHPFSDSSLFWTDHNYPRSCFGVRVAAAVQTGEDQPFLVVRATSGEAAVAYARLIVQAVNERAGLLAALEAIASLGGNMDDESLMTRTGPNDAVARGIMYVGARDIARAALLKAKEGKV